MTITAQQRFKVLTATATALAALMMASCAPLHRSSPQQVEASKPSVTYKYRNDDELIQANERAVTFCNQYQFMPRVESFSNDPDGSKVVVFECVPSSSQQTAMPRQNPNLTYTYRTDQELLDVSRRAQLYCMNSGSPQMTSNIVRNADGSSTVTFRCSPR